MYKVYRDKMLKHSNWANKIHYSDAKSILGFYGLPKEIRESVIKEMFRYGLISRQNQHWIIIKGAKKKGLFF